MNQGAQFRRALGLWDASAIIAGIIIGVGIFRVPAEVAASLPSVGGIVAAWITGGLICLLGAFCLAELASLHPQTGGNYIFLKKAYGPWVAFLFSWMSLLVGRPGSIALIAVVFAEYALQLLGAEPATHGALQLLIAVGVVAVLTAVNIAGVRPGSWVQNILTAAKCLALLSIFFVGLLFACGSLSEHPIVLGPAPESPAGGLAGFGFALIIILWAFGGWDESPYVAGEVKEPERNLPRSILLGLSATLVLYLLVNLSYLLVLSPGEMARSPQIAVTFVERALGARWTVAIALFVLLSSLGGINGLILTSARLAYATGENHRVIGWLAHLDARSGTPVRALLFQAAVTIVALVLLQAKFQPLIYYTSFIYWLFMGLVIGSLFVFRRKEPGRKAPVRAWLYPFSPAVFIAASIYMMHSAWNEIALYGVLITLAGAVVFGLDQRMNRR